MSSFIDTLNLRPQEKRLIVFVVAVVFVVLNVWLVWPHFGEYSRILAKLKAARQDTAKFNEQEKWDDDPTNGYKRQLYILQRQEGGAPTYTGEIALQKAVGDQARACHINVTIYDPVSTQQLGPTNQNSQFFESESMRITFAAKEEDLVKFLYNVGNDPAMIRVRELSLRPADGNRYELKGNITLTADYKKTAAPKAASRASATTAKNTAASTATPNNITTHQPQKSAVQPPSGASKPPTTPGRAGATNTNNVHKFNTRQFTPPPIPVPGGPPRSPGPNQSQ